MKLRITQQADEQYFYGHGKLLLTGEYFVLDGAQALALPTKLGQSLRVKELHAAENTLYWIALNNKKQPWLNLVFDTTDFSCVNSQQEEAQRLSKILSEARKLNSGFLTDKKDRAVETHLEFANDWGLGSSSTLIHCVAQWANVDGYTLLQNSIGGSGYDVASAANDLPVLYQLKNKQPETIAVNWQPVFSDKIYFAHLGKKQSSPDAIKNYREVLKDKTHGVNELTRITETILKCTELKIFEELLNEHEMLVGAELKQMKVRDILFADYWGVVKSLGAWGGDFVLMTNERSEEELKTYLATKSITTVFKWSEIIL